MFSPEDRQAVLELAAEKLVDHIKASVDLPALVTLPLDAVAPIIGLGPKQASRVLPTQPLGRRKLGVTLRALLDYQAKRKP